MSNGQVYGPVYEGPTPLAAPPKSNGGGNFFQNLLAGFTGGAPVGAGGGLGGFLSQGFSAFQSYQSSKEAREAEELAAKRAFELERLRLSQPQVLPPAPAPYSPVSVPEVPSQYGGLALAPGIPPMLFLGGVGLLAAALLLRGRK